MHKQQLLRWGSDKMYLEEMSELGSVKLQPVVSQPFCVLGKLMVFGQSLCYSTKRDTTKNCLHVPFFCVRKDRAKY